ncbi:hypothetical protein F2Q70_00015405 [Brassica cretica]|uniref:Uncharacterized protein n=1 Tax=Brassica cretica TaxID=69181 RepID=A0A3N6QF08_BRACR|nr:hypothetical protein F2Q70_00015405 [Brassica cretica]
MDHQQEKVANWLRSSRERIEAEIGNANELSIELSIWSRTGCLLRSSRAGTSRDHLSRAEIGSRTRIGIRVCNRDEVHAGMEVYAG